MSLSGLSIFKHHFFFASKLNKVLFVSLEKMSIVKVVLFFNRS